MHILLCSKRDLVACLMLRRMLPRLPPARITLLLANRQRSQALAVPQLRLLRLFEEELPNQLLFPLARGAGSPGALVPFEELAARHAVDLVVADGLGRRGRSALYRELAPDLILTFKFGFLLHPEDISLPALGAWNLHSGRLPDRPGLHAVFWAMHDGEKTTAATVHRIDEGIDTGPIAVLKERPIERERSFFHNMVQTYLMGADLLADLAVALAEGRAPDLSPQESTPDRRYLGLPSAEDVARFEAAGGLLVEPEDYLELVRSFLPSTA
ncbi:MAG TPA: formyltransferase family protein [Kiloniellales bacterium]|jgi:methionyl-tRNA formyltransferase|nr:formyltransferase family protein [Kiloniellales bacterium]